MISKLITGFAMTILLMAAGLPLRAEEPTQIPKTPTPNATAAFPADRSITDSQGRKMEVTLQSKTATSVKFVRKADGQEFDLPLEKLSVEDRTFIATLTNPPALAAKTSIKLDVKTTKREIGIAGGQKEAGLITTATPAFEKGADMSDGPALVRIIRIQQNIDKEDRYAVARSCPTSSIEPWVFGQGENQGIWFLWFAEVWQDGKLVCKTYNTNKLLEKLPPARKGEQSVKLYPDKK
jgi:hypothetical protein